MISIMFAILMAVMITACSTPKKSWVDPTPTIDTETECKTPTFYRIDGKDFIDEYPETFELLKLANTNEFEKFVLSKNRVKFSHTNVPVGEAIKLFRSQLTECRSIAVYFYSEKNTFYGGWSASKNRMSQNAYYKMDSIKRAGHLLHEVSHVYNWKHQGNNVNKNNNKNSFPYAIGNDFREFLTKRKG